MKSAQSKSANLLDFVYISQLKPILLEEINFNINKRVTVLNRVEGRERCKKDGKEKKKKRSLHIRYLRRSMSNIMSSLCVRVQGGLLKAHGAAERVCAWLLRICDQAATINGTRRPRIGQR